MKTSQKQLCSSNNLKTVPLGNMYHFYRLETPKFAEVVYGSVLNINSYTSKEIFA